ncbi:MCP methyltransferase, CheR-type [Geoalkalibacter ferrihydriticus]|uniref:protein-glutamate O-methyltransferase n=2 Tax=Geoalkalibacter ferrihydriticus TaxID=392333 RepID=A0A0C2HR69_9BACT|nr:protein-glutamate O-methyltransferase CheR [Geoalkalibacter ferrihydriticus]KIH77370.1 chemotaxis protein CheR [Geoalkalibacter ferrihydriticus DSM 17813]SDM17837.1 MCP methyltransferase, CheR-type [Geoalkalibacter ferrihydriticus]
MFNFTPDIPMTNEEFRLMRELIYQHCGLHFSEDNKYLLEKRLSKQVRLHKFKSFKDYYYLLRYSKTRDDELAQAIDLLTTNETYFFREESQLRTFVEEVIPEIKKRRESEGSRKLRIWSAGCSTGEEPYTLAMLLHRAGLHDWNIDIIGTDISQRVLQVARKGVYGPSSFRTTDSRYIQDYFEESEGKYRIVDEVRRMVNISHLNLFDNSRVSLLGHMDAIFCRNVIIYFDLEAKKKVVENFFQRLHPGGFLMLGHSESLINVSTRFALRHFTHDMVYQHPLKSGDQPGGGRL